MGRDATGAGPRPLTRDDLLERDRNDPLAGFRDRFQLPEGVIYLDGNSLGPPSVNMRPRIETLLGGEWGRDLIGSWNRHGWFRLPERVGARIAPLLGADEDEVIAADSVSLNLFKLLGALLRRAGERRVVLADESNFPTDLADPIAREHRGHAPAGCAGGLRQRPRTRRRGGDAHPGGPPYGADA